MDADSQDSLDCKVEQAWVVRILALDNDEGAEGKNLGDRVADLGDIEELEGSREREGNFVAGR